VVRQFLAGATEGPIGMSEEADAGRNGSAPAAVSTSGMTAEETEALEREAGAPAANEAGRVLVTVPAKPEQGATADEPSSEAAAGGGESAGTDDAGPDAAGGQKTPEELAVGAEAEPNGRDGSEDAAIAEPQADRQGLDVSPASPGDGDQERDEERE
jgi:hypothetical protein